MLGMLALMPLSLAWVKRYQHGYYVYAGQRSRLETGTGDFYFYALKLFALGLLIGVVGALVMGVGVALASAVGGKGMGAVIGVLSIIGFYALYFVLLMPFAQSRLQNMVWGGTRSEALRFRSALKLG